MIAGQQLTELDIEGGLERAVRARRDLGQGEGLALADPEQAPDTINLGRAVPAIGLTAGQQPVERFLGRLVVQAPAVGQGELGARPAQEALLDPVACAIDLEIERDPRGCALVAGRLQAPDRLGLGAVALEQDCPECCEQGRLAHLVGADHQVQAVGQARDPDRPVELPELLELEGAKLHGAASLRCSA